MDAERAADSRKILLVDDEPSVLFALRLLLQALGHTVVDYPAADKALEFLQQDDSCDVFICDLRMPRMTGLQALSALQKIRPSLPFILMSAHANTQEVNTALELGAKGFLAKPFSPDKLKVLLAQLSTSLA